MRKLIVFLIILTILGTAVLITMNVVKKPADKEADTTVELAQPIDLSGLDYQPTGSITTVTDASAQVTSNSFTISMDFVGDIMLAGNETATSSIDAMASSQPSTYFFEMMISRLQTVKTSSPITKTWSKQIREKPPRRNNMTTRSQNTIPPLHLRNRPEQRSIWKNRNTHSAPSGSAQKLQMPSFCRKMVLMSCRSTTITPMISERTATWIRALP